MAESGAIGIPAEAPPFAEPEPGEAFEVRGRPLDPGPSLLWQAPGTLDAAGVETAWRTRGLRGLARQPGPWAVVLWDHDAREHVVAADPVGVQPLYWARNAEGVVVVSSRIAAIANRPDVDDALDYDGIVIDQAIGCLGPGSLEYTRFKAIRRIPWGRALRVRPDGSVRLVQYWDLADVPGPDESLTADDCSELLRERIDAAIRRLTPGDGRVGAHVSGGLDSTSIAFRADQILEERGSALVAGYSWSPTPEHVPRFAGDERELLDAVAAAARFPIRLVHPDESGDWWIRRDPNTYPQSTQLRERWTLPQAWADGVRVMLSGWGGDQVASYAGGGTLSMLARSGRLRTAWRQTRLRRERAGRLGAAGTATDVARLLSPQWVSRIRHPRRWAAGTAEDARVDGIVRAVSPAAADLRREQARAYGRCRTPSDFQRLLLASGGVQARIGSWYQVGRLWKLEYRYPLLDLGVVEGALSLPWWAWLEGGDTRVAFRRAVASWVPQAVADRPKLEERAISEPPQRIDVRSSAEARRPWPGDARMRDAMRAIGATFPGKEST